MVYNPISKEVWHIQPIKKIRTKVEQFFWKLNPDYKNIMGAKDFKRLK